LDFTPIVQYNRLLGGGKKSEKGYLLIHLTDFTPLVQSYKLKKKKEIFKSISGNPGLEA
jgi:hypothetical protein